MSSTRIPSLALTEADSAARSEALDAVKAIELLESGECPVCHFAIRCERRYFFSFANEHYNDPGTIGRVDAALGFCPRHCRTLIRSDPYFGTMTDVYLHVVAAARRRLEEPASPEGPCIGCKNEQWAIGFSIDLILRTLAQTLVAAAYRERGGLCARHLLDATTRSSPETLGPALEVLEERLSAPGGGAPAIAILAGSDSDSAIRASFLKDLTEALQDSPGERSRPALESLSRSLRVPSCPSCLASGQAGRRNLRWIGTERARRLSGFGREVAGLCPAHLLDLARLDPETGEWLALERAAVWRGILSRFRRRAEEIPPAAARARWRALRDALKSFRPARSRSSRERALEAASLALFPRRHWERRARAFRDEFPHCGACRAEDTAGRRTTALLLAALEDRFFARRYERAHGLCLRHVMQVPESLRQTPLEVCRARLRLLEWELREADRKLDWFVRYEPGGSESTAWRRAMGQIDGRVFLGGPATSVLKTGAV